MKDLGFPRCFRSINMDLGTQLTDVFSQIHLWPKWKRAAHAAFRAPLPGEAGKRTRPWLPHWLWLRRMEAPGVNSDEGEMENTGIRSPAELTGAEPPSLPPGGPPRLNPTRPETRREQPSCPSLSRKTEPIILRGCRISSPPPFLSPISPSQIRRPPCCHGDGGS